MNLARRRLLHLAAGAAALPAVSSIAWAQAYPWRPITMVVPVPAGGQMDSIARIVAEHMRTALSQPIVVENVTGASGTIGVGRVARAAPDGYTLVYGAWATQVVNGAVYALQYDLINDFEPIALTSITPWLISAKAGVPASDLKGLIAWLKANPDKASAGTSGAGGPGHIGGVLFQKLSGTRFQFVPYRGMTPAMQDLVSGQIDIMIADPASALPQFRAGRIKVFAVTANRRLAVAPDIPTVDEAGLP
jgi:tripartite-type tricarboxylate transporter receptor subunit TctC